MASTLHSAASANLLPRVAAGIRTRRGAAPRCSLRNVDARGGRYRVATEGKLRIRVGRNPASTWPPVIQQASARDRTQISSHAWRSCSTPGARGVALGRGAGRADHAEYLFRTCTAHQTPFWNCRGVGERPERRPTANAKYHDPANDGRLEGLRRSLLACSSRPLAGGFVLAFIYHATAWCAPASFLP